MNILDLLPRYTIYLEHERKMAIETRTAYLSDLRSLARFTSDDVTNITVDTLRAYIRHLSLQGKAVRTIQRRIHAFSTFWDWLQMEHIVNEIITQRIRVPKAPERKPPWLNARQLEVWATTPTSSLRDELAWKTLAWFGLRRSELLYLHVCDVKLDVKLLVIRDAKAGSDRSLAIPDPLVDGFIRLIEDKKLEDYVFEGDGGGQWKKRDFYKAFYQHVENCGLQGLRITPHILRHTFATHLRNRGVDIVTVQKLLGHKNIQSTQIYSHVASEWLVEAMSRHPLYDLEERTKKK